MHYKKNYSYGEYMYCYWFIGNCLICISKGVTRTREIRLVLAFTFYYNFFWDYLHLVLYEYYINAHHGYSCCGRVYEWDGRASKWDGQAPQQKKGDWGVVIWNLRRLRMMLRRNGCHIYRVVTDWKYGVTWFRNVAEWSKALAC